MDPAELLALVERTIDRFSFHGALATLSPQCEVRGTEFGVHLTLQISVPDRESGEDIRVMFLHNLAWHHLVRLSDCEGSAEHIRLLLTRWFLDVWKHEFEEGLQFDGMRLLDPHKNDRGNPHMADKRHP